MVLTGFWGFLCFSLHAGPSSSKWFRRRHQLVFHVPTAFDDQTLCTVSLGRHSRTVHPYHKQARSANVLVQEIGVLNHVFENPCAQAARRGIVWILSISSICCAHVCHFGTSTAVGQHASCRKGCYILHLKNPHAANARQQAAGYCNYAHSSSKPPNFETRSIQPEILHLSFEPVEPMAAAMGVCLALRLATLALPCAAGASDRRLDGTTTTSSYIASSSLQGQAYAGAGEACSAICSSWNYCCNDWQLGSNQYISCAQACMMRYRGESEDSVRSQCPEQQCSVDVGGFTYALCASCEDLHDGCRFGVQDEWACYSGASVEVCQPSIYEDGKVVTLYHPGSKRYLGVGSYAGSGRRITAMHGGFQEDSGSLWQLRYMDGGVQFLSVGQSGPASDFLPDDRPLGNDWFLAGCGMESVINVDAPRTFSIRQSISSSVLFSVSTHDLACSPAGRFGAEWELLVEEFPRKAYVCGGDTAATSAAKAARSAFWVLTAGALSMQLFAHR